MMDAKHIAELDRVLDRILAGHPESATHAAKAAAELRSSIVGSPAKPALNSDQGDVGRGFERSVALASALAVLECGREVDEDETARLARASNLLLAMECRRLRSALAHAELSATQWRERSLSAASQTATADMTNAFGEEDCPPWDPRHQRRKLDQIADLIGAFKGSLQWRLGHAVITLAERVLMRKSQPTALDAAESLARSDSQ